MRCAHVGSSEALAMSTAGIRTSIQNAVSPLPTLITHKFHHYRYHDGHTWGHKISSGTILLPIPDNTDILPVCTLNTFTLLTHKSFHAYGVTCYECRFVATNLSPSLKTSALTITTYTI